jgi:hypothetical protein
VRDAFADRGHLAISCDLLDTEMVGPHWKGDVRELLDYDWDLLIGHPPCTYLTNSGARWLHEDESRWAKLDEACEFFSLLLYSKIPKKCIENPIIHGYAKERIGMAHSQNVHPWMFGHMEQKTTCLWLENLPLLVETKNVRAEMKKLPEKDRARVHYAAPSEDRWRDRSRTYQGLADAMAAQWG